MSKRAARPMAGADPVLVVGTVAYDTIKTPFGSAERVLGGSACYFSGASSLFAPTHLVSVVGEDFDHAELGFLAQRGVDLSGLATVEGGRTFHWSGEYHFDMNTRTTHATDLNVLTGFDPVVPEAARRSPVVFLANIDPELQLKVLDQVASPRLVAADTMNFWIEGKPDPLRDVLARLDVLVINDEEARELAGTPHLTEAVGAIRDMGPGVVVVKKGEHGCLLANGEDLFVAPAFLLANVTDPTGAGDAFAGGFMGILASAGGLSDAALRRATVYGTACASLVIEDFGPGALAKATRRDIDARAERLAQFARFPEL